MPDLKRWIVKLREDIRARSEEVCQVVSDVSDELYLNALTAVSLREHGRGRRGENPFWVRSEWRKHDLRYGRSGYFGGRTWDEAWEQGASGHLGHIESKLVYTHHVTDQFATLQRQLEERRSNDAKHGRSYQSYHGLIWAFHHGDGTSDDDEMAIGGLERIDARFRRDAEKLDDVESGFEVVFRHDLGAGFWPTYPERYVGRLWVRLVSLTR